MWRKLNGEHLKKPIVDEVEQTLKREHELGNKLKVCIGTDSQVYGNTIEFATVIVFVRDKRGGFMFINSEKTKQKSHLKQGGFFNSKREGQSLKATTF